MISLPMDTSDTSLLNPVPFETAYKAATTATALFDVSDRGKIEVSGPDAPSFLSNLSTNDIKNLPLGGGCETYFLDHRGKALFQTIAYHVLLGRKNHAIWLETTAGRGQKLLQHLDRFLISEAVELTEVTEQFAQFHLAGPTAHAVLQSALSEDVPVLDEFLHMERTFGSDSTCSIRSRQPLGLPGFDIVCLREKAAGVMRLLIAAGAVAADGMVYETLRVEAGTPLYGIDIDENRFVMEVGNAARAVCYTKGCFVGQEPIVMARDRSGHVNRAFMGLKVLSGGPLPAGTKLFHEGKDVGVTTSSVLSTKWNLPIALGYLRRGSQEPGMKLEADLAGTKVPVELLGPCPLTTVNG